MYHSTPAAIGTTQRQTLSSPGTMPYMTASPSTRTWQQAANALNAAEGLGLTPLVEDGILGPRTCARAQELSVPSPAQCVTRSTAPGPAVPTPGVSSRLPGSLEAGMGGGTNWLLIGGGVGLVAVGLAVALRKGKK